ADEVEPFLEAVARQGAGGGCEVLLRCQVGDVLDDGRAFAQAGAVVEFEHGDVAEGVDAVVVSAVGQLVAPGAREDGLEGDAGFAQRDMGREGAGAGRKVQLHGMDSGKRMGKGKSDARGRIAERTPCYR